VKVKLQTVRAGEPVPPEVASFRAHSGNEVSQPTFIGDVVLAYIGDYVWTLPAHDVSGWSAVFMEELGSFNYFYNLVVVSSMQTWTTDAKTPPKSVAGIDISGGGSWRGPVSWSFKSGDEVPDWMMSFEPQDPGVNVEFVFEGDVEVVDLEYGTWILPHGHPHQSTAVKPKKTGEGRAKIFATTRDLVWPTRVVVGFKGLDDGGGGGPEPDPVDPTPPVTPVLEPA
jgi:hypothetical protein